MRTATEARRQDEAGGDGHHVGRALVVRRPLAVDLFAGAGGLSLGLEQAGFDVVASVEYDPVHAATHKFNFPLTEVLCRDVSSLPANELRAAAGRGRAAHGHAGKWDGKIDLIVGGPPCQGFSLIGKRLIDDPRNSLVFHFFRLVNELRPRYFCMENVPGMNVGGHSSILSRLVEEFEAEGFKTVKPVEALNAADYGVPQERHRLFLLGASGSEALPSYPPPSVRPARNLGEDERSDEGAELPVGPTVWEAIGDLPDLDRFEELLDSDEVELLDAHVGADASEYASLLRGSKRDPSDLSHPREWPTERLTSSMRTRHTRLSISRFSVTPQGGVEAVSRFHRLHPDGLCNTLRAGTGTERGAYTSPRPIHPFLPRVISVREAARLHSFPDWFRFHRTKWHGFRQIGNAVAPLVARAVGCCFAEALGVAPPTPTQPLALGDASLLGMKMRGAAQHFGAEPSEIPPPRRRDPSAGTTAR